MSKEKFLPPKVMTVRKYQMVWKGKKKILERKL